MPCTDCDPVGSSSSTPSSSPSAARAARIDARRLPSFGRDWGRSANTSCADDSSSRSYMTSSSASWVRATHTITLFELRCWLQMGGAVTNVVITGGAGFLGSRIARQLLSTGSLEVGGDGPLHLSHLALIDSAPIPSDM